MLQIYLKAENMKYKRSLFQKLAIVIPVVLIFDLHGIYVYRYGVGRFFKCHGLQLVHADCGIVRCVYVPFGKQ